MDDFPKLKGVADVIYNPYRTALLIEAEQRGIPYTDGLPMLQAVAAAKLFMQKEFPPEATEAIIRQMRHAQENIILIGMPGVGKTTIALRSRNAYSDRSSTVMMYLKNGTVTPANILKPMGKPNFVKKKRPSWPNFAKPPEPLLPPAAAL